MSKKIKVKLKTPKKTLSLDDKQISLGDGYCKFPFLFKEQMYDECYKGKHGDWCATVINPKTRKMKAYAFCDYDGPANNKPGPANNKPGPANNKPGPTKKVKKVTIKIVNNKKSNANNQKPNNVKKSKKTLILKKSKFVPESVIDKNMLVPAKKRIIPKIWELPNRKTFQNWFNKTYTSYRAKKNSMKSPSKGLGFDFFNHQKIVSDYINSESPFRGLLLFHGLGVGKTCAAIGIAECFTSGKEIVIMLNKSLKKNFIVNLMKCGFEYFRISQHWVYHTFRGESDNMLAYAKYLKVPAKSIKNGGAWFVDFSKPSNYDSLTIRQHEQLNEQIDLMIKKKYTFIHLDGLNQAKLESMVESKVLDNKLLIIDEVHNLTNAMAKTYPGVRGKYLKQLIMEASNLKCVFLSGTPMINNLYEAGQLFNILRGYIYSCNFVIKKNNSSAPNIEQLDSILKSELKQIDQLFIDKKNSIINVTQTPFGFAHNDKFDGLVNSSLNNINHNEFNELVKTTLSKIGYNIIQNNVTRHTALPDKEDEFLTLFFDNVRNEIKNPSLLQSRILGLVSYFRTQDKSLLPTVTKDELIEIPMSEYQFLKYSEIRKAEIESEKTSKSKKPSKPKRSKTGEEDIFDDKKSSYRAYSRMHCSFVFPEAYPRPFPGDSDEPDLSDNSEEILSDDILDENEDPLDIELKDDLPQDKKIMIKQYEKAKSKILRELNKVKETIFTINESEQLLKYSPKYNNILDKVSKLNGTAFIYTEYKTLEGIAILQVILKANGYAPFLIKQNDEGEWFQDFESEDDIDKPKYAFWGGNEEQSDILRKIYNNDFEDIPKSLARQILESGKNNLRGDIIKILLTTKTGAEGIDLKNVRQVHIVEPYWNPVRTKQVKGRAIRVGSHLQLPEKDRTVEIYQYLSIMTPEQLASDKNMQVDHDGNTSDQVLYNISSKKLEIMEYLLRLIKEVSVDCNINLAETRDNPDEFTCITHGSSPSRNEYTYVPDILKEHGDVEKQRRTTVTKWKPVFIKVPTSKGVKEFAIKMAMSEGEPNLIFDAAATRTGQPGNPIGELIENDGKKKFKFYKK